MDNCPSCNRAFKNLSDFPLVQIVAVSLAKPSDIPASIPDWHEENYLVAEPVEGQDRELVPADVLAYFSQNPGVEELIHSDGYIYRIPVWDIKEFAQQYSGKESQPGRSNFNWRRAYNHAPAIKAMMESNPSVKQYFDNLAALVGEEVPTSRVLPTWHMDSRFHQFVIPDSDNPIHGPYGLGMYDTEERNNGFRTTELVLLGRGPDFRSAGGPTLMHLLQLGSIQYEGKVHVPK